MYLSCDYCDEPVHGNDQINTIINGLGMIFCNNMCYDLYKSDERDKVKEEINKELFQLLMPEDVDRWWLTPNPKLEGFTPSNWELREGLNGLHKILLFLKTLGR